MFSNKISTFLCKKVKSKDNVSLLFEILLLLFFVFLSYFSMFFLLFVALSSSSYMDCIFLEKILHSAILEKKNKVQTIVFDKKRSCENF